MVARNILSRLGITNDQVEQQLNELFREEDRTLLQKALEKKVDALTPGLILPGTIVSQIGNDVIVEVGLKSEGILEASEFDDPADIEPGKTIEVLLEEVDSEGGMILLSKRKADRIRGWENIVNTKKEGDVVTGKVIRRIKGGLLIDIGVPVFLPASQVDIRKPGDISRFIGEDVQCKILKIDIENHNIVVSRRKLIEEARESSKRKILDEIVVGQTRKGVVKNIADFGVFVDLGGLDGLLHISDLSWGRISHPSEVVRLDQQIDCVVIGVDKTSEKISLGLKQKTQNPWQEADKRYPIGSRVKGVVVNLTNYGAFVEIEPGIDGLIHISDLSWTKKYTHPNEVLEKGQEVKCVVLDVDPSKQRISLGIKQLIEDPWHKAIPEKYLPGQIVKGVVRKLTNFGVFVELEQDLDGLLHISELADHKIESPQDVVTPGQEVEVKILRVDTDARKIGLSMRRVQWAAETEHPQHIQDVEEPSQDGGANQARRGGLGDGGSGMLIDFNKKQEKKDSEA